MFTKKGVSKETVEKTKKSEGWEICMESWTG